MPVPAFDPDRQVLDVSVSVATASTITAVATLCGAKSLSFCSLSVLRNVQHSMDHTASQHPSVKPLIEDFQLEIEAAVTELSASHMVDPTLAAGFTTSKEPVLSVLTRFPTRGPDEFYETVGNMLVTAWLTNLAPSINRFKRLHALTSSFRNEPQLTELQTSDLHTLLHRSRADLLEVLSQRSLTKDKVTLRFNAELLIHLRSGLNSQHIEEQQCADQRKYLPLSSLTQKTSALEAEVHRGDANALVTLIAFCIGLTWDLTTQIPMFSSDEHEGSLAWLDIRTGEVYVKIKPLLRDLGQAVAGCEVTSDVLRLPLPMRLADALKTAVAQRPQARRLGDLLDEPTAHTADWDELWSVSHRTRFIRSAVVNAIRLDPNRAVAAFAFLSFHLITGPDLHYLTVSEAAVWSMRSKFFQSVGLGDTNSPDLAAAHKVGSMRTAERDMVRSIFEELDSSVAAVRVGRRYSLGTLVEHHNRYARRVAMFLQFAAAARSSAEIDFPASSWFFGSVFGYLNDKDSGTAGGRTPIPISPTASEQLRLWELHLQSLRQRLRKLLGLRARSADKLIQRILERNQLSIFFLLDESASVRPLRSEDLFVGRSENLNRDFGRHFLASLLTDRGSPISDVQVLLRHQGDAINPGSAFGVEGPQPRLQRVAITLDRILIDLNIRPLPGVGGSAG
ncbi:hypothetical protein J2W49_004863 [Hydrogenophaga palleronii]|uniref:Uncharacterized protein n=1 Tax=Hydrogenophaga palleronii TaxID=65655 RepID=A0ABU1WUC5_9BURK|nr:hypothetical protein [Hydrogenophaga palleronii]MDR7152885.1 hypothetical protein [Hydrogenophaga palleronii]